MNLSNFAAALGQLLFKRLILGRLLRRRDQRQLGRGRTAREHAVQRVIVVGRNRVVLVVVAAGAGDRQAQQAAGRRVDLVVDVVVVVVELAARRQKAERGQGVLVVASILRQAVGGQLLGDELVVRQIAVERPNDVVAVGVGIRKPPLLGEGVALGIGVAGHVEPVPAPALAIMGRGQQPIDQPLVGIGCTIGEKRFDFLRRRRQADKVISQAADERAAVGFGGRSQAGRLEPGQNERVEAGAEPVGRP